MKFIDEATIYVQSGAGGNGCISFRREKYVPRGGPDGGNGGTGGSVFLVGSKDLSTLYDLKTRPHYRAAKGQHGKGKKQHGKDGKAVYISVPLGIVVCKEERLVGEILKDKEKLLVAAGGRGGRGNAHFVSSTNRAPRRAEDGGSGEKTCLKIVLKIISDIGIVGLPNAGKSTLLKALTNARPRIGSYPFTTLNPNLGVLKDNRRRVVVADMPGIIEGAHRGKGIGLQFLRHIERTNLLMVVIDVSAPEPQDQYETLLGEFKNYNPILLKKPRIVVMNKIDLVDRLPHLDIEERTFCVSALKGIGVDLLIEYLKNEN
ncbi:MAG: GTPase ObgE [candidate division WOR-3 bacterium]|nr:MAG: GTPase ObgE [candidate division WOR-3 bacterium]